MTCDLLMIFFLISLKSTRRELSIATSRASPRPLLREFGRGGQNLPSSAGRVRPNTPADRGLRRQDRLRTISQERDVWDTPSLVHHAGVGGAQLDIQWCFDISWAFSSVFLRPPPLPRKQYVFRTLFRCSCGSCLYSRWSMVGQAGVTVSWRI